MDLRRSGRLVNKRGDALVKVIDVHDDDDDDDDGEFGEVGVLEVVEEEEEEEWEPGRGRKSARKKCVERRTKRGEKGTGVTSIKQGEADGKPTEVSRSGKRGLENGDKTSPVDVMEALSHGLRSVCLSSAENGHSRDAGIVRNEVKPRAQDEAKSCHGVRSCLENRVGNSRGSEIVLNAVAQEFVVVGPSKDGIMERGIQEDIIDLSSSGSSDDGGEGYDDTEEQNAREQERVDPIPNGEQAALLAKVTKVLQEGGELKNLKADHLKAYLRHHRLRLAGLKAVLLNRVEDHLKFKDGQAEVSYPRASFSINCKGNLLARGAHGDVCLGDVVLFLQNVYEQHSYTNLRQRGKHEGTRWVAGKVVNESYGVDKQQHTFTIEVVWSTGLRPCYCMQPLLIKGRNLYRKNIMRLRWTDEAERQKVLDEKHARGAAARAQRAVGASSSRGRSRSRATSRSDSNTREQGELSRISRPTIPPSQNSVQHDRTRTQQTNVHRGSTGAHSYTRNRPAESDRIPPPVQSSMQHGWAHTEQQLGRAHSGQQHRRADHTEQQHGRADHTEQQHGRAHSGQQHRRADHAEQQHGRADHTEQQHGRAHSGQQHRRADHAEQQHGRADHTEQQHGRADHTEQQHGRAHSGQQHGRADHTEQQHGRAHSGQQHRRADHAEQQHGRADHTEQQHGRADHTEQQHGRAHSGQQHRRADHAEQQHGRADHTEQQHGRAHSGQQHRRADHAEQQHGRADHTEQQHGRAHSGQQHGRADHTEQQHGRAHSGQQHRRADHAEQQHGRADHTEQQHGRAHSGQQHRRADHAEQQHGRADHTEQQHGRAHSGQQHGRADHTEQQHGRAHSGQQYGMAHSGQQHGRAQTKQYGRGTYTEDRVYRTNTRAQGPFSRTCSTVGCENLSANHCILRSCGLCCYRYGSIRGSCPRHQ